MSTSYLGSWLQGVMVLQLYVESNIRLDVCIAVHSVVLGHKGKHMYLCIVVVCAWLFSVYFIHLENEVLS